MSTEDSTMFTLDRLVAGTAAPSAPGSVDEDSGLIDLQALARGAASMGDGAAPTPWFAGSHFPLGDPLPALAPAAPAAPVTPAPRPRGRPLLIGLASAALLLAAAVVFLLVRGPQKPPESPVDTSTAQPARSMAVPAEGRTDGPPPSAGATLSSAASATITEAPSAPPATIGSPSRPRPGPLRPGQANQASPARRANQPPTPPAASESLSGDCRCKPNDLDCHMHCSVGRRR